MPAGPAPSRKTLPTGLALSGRLAVPPVTSAGVPCSRHPDAKPSHPAFLRVPPRPDGRQPRLATRPLCTRPPSEGRTGVPHEHGLIAEEKCLRMWKETCLVKRGDRTLFAVEIQAPCGGRLKPLWAGRLPLRNATYPFVPQNSAPATVKNENTCLH